MTQVLSWVVHHAFYAIVLPPAVVFVIAERARRREDRAAIASMRAAGESGQVLAFPLDRQLDTVRQVRASFDGLPYRARSGDVVDGGS